MLLGSQVEKEEREREMIAAMVVLPLAPKKRQQPLLPSSLCLHGPRVPPPPPSSSSSRAITLAHAQNESGGRQVVL